jgi:hypothetical protein
MVIKKKGIIMKNYLKKYLLALSLLGIALHINAYHYSFFNRTQKPIAVAIQFLGEGEPLYKKLIKPQSKETFEEGKFEIPLIKSGFCLKHIYYVIDPTSAQKKNKLAAAPWKERSIAWLPDKIYKKAIERATKAASKKQAPLTEDVGSTKELIKSHKTKKLQSLCKDQQFDIVADERGKPFFIALEEE